ncbi:uncharacterized protein EI90DRAFT_2359736 [Cantharellus anzutake]|uniref:uncharacterized protein n=1 Tax=Cantharellus anzutake TaxID=1750568 RepID=UPI001908E9BF|nr:uncharacterized protein EI90DRAFT_2359736 [Cantharellus anzutake]KAF8324346.1 hypothetical protein EI90DRAFT_2359736 [Cantharellus anzutake]
MTDWRRKWDQPGDDDITRRGEEGSKSAEAAAAAAAIAAKIAAQFANPGSASGILGPRDPHDAAFTYDIEINDVRNRYVLTKGTTQTQINQETGASVTTKGVWYPDKSKATEKDPPLYLHISANTEEQLNAAREKVEEIIAMELGLTEKKDDRPQRRKWPEAKLAVGLESIRLFNVRAKVVGPQGAFVKYIQQETGTRVQIKGLGSGFVEADTQKEADEPMHIHITGPDEGQVDRAKVLTEDLLEVVRAEWAKAKAIMDQQQMELQQAQAQYAAYNAYNGYAPPPPADAPPPPPSDVPPPPPPDGTAPPPGGAGTGPPSASTSPGSQQDWTAYWAAYGYDTNSDAFKEWQKQAQEQYAAYYAAYAQQGAQAPSQPEGSPVPPPPAPSDPPPPPPPS